MNLTKLLNTTVSLIILVIISGNSTAHAGGLTDLIKLREIDSIKAAITIDNINEPDELGMTPLMLAVEIGDVEIAATLIDSGADVSRPGSRDSITNSPLAIASWENDDIMISLLMEYDARDSWLSNLPDFDPFGLFPYILSEIDIDTHPGYYEGYFDENSSPYVTETVRNPRIHGPCGEGLDRNIISSGDDYSLDHKLFMNTKYSDGVLIEDFVAQPAYLSRNGVVFPRGISRIEDGGPFVDIQVQEHTSRVKSITVNNSGERIPLTEIDNGLFEATVGGIDECETIMIELHKQNGDVIAVYEIVCELRGAVPGAVTTKMSRWPGNSGHLDDDGSDDSNDDHGNDDNGPGHGGHGNGRH